MGIYTITDWLGLVPISVCIGFGMLGLMQWIRRKGITKVDRDIFVSGHQAKGNISFTRIPEKTE